jgi:hypothetical protein
LQGIPRCFWLNFIDNRRCSEHDVLEQSFNEIFKAYEAKTGKKLEVAYIPLSELDVRRASNPEDFGSYLHKVWATAGPFLRTDNDLYPEWNPSSVLDNIPVL